jgi:hypothetical protein
MATLQTSRQWSASTAKARLKHLSHQPPLGPQVARTTPDVPPDPATIPPVPNSTHPDQDRLPVLQQRKLLLQAASIYPGWQLVSIQQRPESDVLIAYLVRSRDRDDPTLAIREGRALQIIMDASGDLRIHRPHQRHPGLFVQVLRWLATVSHSRGSTAFAWAR